MKAEKPSLLREGGTDASIRDGRVQYGPDVIV